MTDASLFSSKIKTDLDEVVMAARKLATLKDELASAVIRELADLAVSHQDFLLQQNKLDLERMPPDHAKYDRLLLTADRIAGIASDLRNVADLPSPLHRILEARLLPSGLSLTKITVPLGLVGIIYESRPNVTFDVFALNLKAGNATILKGSRDAHYSNTAIKVLIDEVLGRHQLAGICYLAPSDREALVPILEAAGIIDVIIPRGSQELINYVRKHSRVPVIETGAGIVHTYFDASGNLEKGQRIIENAKARRVSVCNALDTLIIHRSRLADLPALLDNLGKKHHCLVHADAEARQALDGHYPAELLDLAESAHYGQEFLSMQMAIKTVADLSGALEHIHRYSSRHSEAIIAEDQQVVDQFLATVDAAVVYANTSTAFTDGAQFGLGAEIGISTQKLHARGPMALTELTSYKWVVRGDGAIRT